MLARMRMLVLATLLAFAFPLAASEQEIRKVMDQYVAAWLAGDSAAVMRLLAPDAVLIPGPRPALVGAAAIRNYWWPPDGPQIALTRFTSAIDGIVQAGGMATVRGTQVIEWTSGGERWRTRGNSVTVLRRDGGAWRILLLMAASAPNEKLE